MRLYRILKYGKGYLDKVARNLQGSRQILLKDLCAYCNNKLDITIDHIEARSVGGSNSISNLTAACRRCNQEKGAKSLIIYLIYRMQQRRM